MPAFYTEERRREILRFLEDRKSVSVEELASRLFVSPATIRRDLSQMERDGFLKRSHGGAVLFESLSDETSLLVREQENVREKRTIARLASSLLCANATVFLDSSSTAGYLIPFFQEEKYLSVVTNGLNNAMLLSRLETVKTFLAGGMLQPRSYSAAGGETLEMISGFHAELAFLSCGGISAKNGVTDASYDQALIKRKMLENAKTRVLLCDSSKFDAVFMCRTCGFDRIDWLVTDREPPEHLRVQADKEGCRLLYPKPGE